MKKNLFLILFVLLSINSINAQWVQTNGPFGGAVYCFAKSGTNLFAGTEGEGGVFLSTNNGNSWTAVNNGLTNQYVLALAVSETNLFAGTEGGGVFLSTNNGNSWINKNQGFHTITTVSSLLIANNYIFAGTFYQSVWRRSYQEIIGIKNISVEIPTKYYLSQNYPNPFNPTTNIRFEIPRTSIVKLFVYDILGKEVATLVNEKLGVGSYEVVWPAPSGNTSGYPSGVYFYKLITDGFVDVKKMLLIK